MAWDAEQKAELTKKRGQAAAYIGDKDEQRKFISAQGDREGKGNVSDSEYERMSRQADDTLATQGSNLASGAKSPVLGSMKKGGTAKKTGRYQLHEGERAVPRTGIRAIGGRSQTGKRFGGSRSGGCR